MDHTLQKAQQALARGDLTQAERLLRQILKKSPRHLDATYLLGTVLGEQGKIGPAKTFLQRALGLHPGSARVLTNLASVHTRAGEPAQAEACLREAIALEPDLAAAHHNLSRLLLKAGRPGEALQSLRFLAAQQGGVPAGWLKLGDALEACGDFAGAIEAYRRVQAIDPAHPTLAFRLSQAAAGKVPPRTPDADTVRHYRDRAAAWDTSTDAGREEQRAAVELRRSLEPPGTDLRVLDLGCGTGACAAWLRPAARRLVGVDLSPEMLAIARAKGVYDALHEAELEAFLGAGGEPYDLIVAAAVFIHFGVLDGPFAALRARLAPGGRFACSLYRSSDTLDVYEFTFFAHPEAAVRAAVEAAGLRLDRLEAITHDLVKGQVVAGWLLLCSV